MEKTLYAQTGDIQGKKPSGEVVLTFQHAPPDDHLKQTRGMSFALVEVKADTEQNGINTAKDIFEWYKSKFYSGSGGNLKALEETVEFLKDELKKKGLAAELLIANLWGSVVYLAKLGSGEFVLTREGKAKKLEISKIASGVLRDKDTLTLATASFSTNVGLEELGEASSKENFNELIKELNEKVRDKEGASFCLRLTVQEPVETAKPVLIADLDKPKVNEKDLEKEIDLVPTSQKQKEGILARAKEISRRYWVVARPRLVQAYGVGRELARRAAIIILSPWLPRTIGSTDSLEARKRKRIIQVVVVLGAILILSIGFGVWNHSRSVARENFNKAINSIESKLEDAQNLQDINSAEAAGLLSEAEEELSELDKNNEKVQSLDEKIKILLAQINKIYTAELAELADLTAIKGGVETTKLKIEGKDLFILDSGTGSIYKVNLDDKEPEILLSEADALQNFASSGSFLYAQTGSGILRVDSETGSDTLVASNSSDWKTLIEAATYRDNFYLLDKEVKQIWKAVPAPGGLSSPSGYFQEEFSEEPVSFAVDGAIWVATKTEILKYFGGRQAKFSVNGQPLAFDNITNIFTKEGLANLYILDKEAGGVFVIRKDDGQYLGLYKNSQISVAKGVVVDEANKNVYILTGEEIKTFKLR